MTTTEESSKLNKVSQKVNQTKENQNQNNENQNENNENQNERQALITNKIHIKIKPNIFTLEKDTYNPSLLYEIISENDYNKIISRLEKVIGESWIHKKNSDQIKMPKNVIYISLSSIIFTIIYMIFLYLSTITDTGIVYLIISIISISLSVIIIFTMSIFNYMRTISKFQTLDEIIKENLEKEVCLCNLKYKRLKFEYDDVEKRIVLQVI